MSDSLQDWAQLPKDLLDLIAKCLETSFGRLQFRSVCSSWRSAVAAKPSCSVINLPILPENGGGLFLDSGSGFRLSRRTIFLIGLQKPYSRSEPFAWLVKIQDDAPRKRIIDPLSDRYYSLPDDFPRSLDLSRFRVRELGKEYKLHYFNNAGNIVDSLYLEKAVVKYLDNDLQNEFVLLTIHVSGKLAVFKSSDGEWTIVHDMPSPYDDVILFKGQFYAVDNTGRTVVLDFVSMKVTLAANPVFGGDKKFLVESLGELLLVDMYLSFETVEGGPGFIEEYFENLAYYMNERTVRFKAFRFDQNGKMWVEVENMGDRMLFLGDDCTFSASISEISPSGTGAPIFFNGNVFNGEEYGLMRDPDIGVFEFETDKIERLEKHLEYAKFFWPPPHWIMSSSSEVSVSSAISHELQTYGLVWKRVLEPSLSAGD